MHGNILRHTLDTLILHKTAYFKQFSTFQLLKNLKNKFYWKTLRICVKVVTTT